MKTGKFYIVKLPTLQPPSATKIHKVECLEATNKAAHLKFENGFKNWFLQSDIEIIEELP